VNAKLKGERGQSIVIGELGKWGIDVAIPMSDNYPFDFIIIGEKLLKVQVKSTTEVTANGAVLFSFTSNDWYTGITKNYSTKDCDIIIGLDLRTFDVYLFGPEDFENKNGISIRKTTPKNGQSLGIHFHDNYIICEKRIKDTLGINTTFGFAACQAKAPKEYEGVCKKCGKTFKSKWSKNKYCGPDCYALNNRKCIRPSKEELLVMLEKESWVAISRKYNVTDNSVRKWARQYGLIT